MSAGSKTCPDPAQPRAGDLWLEQFQVVPWARWLKEPLPAATSNRGDSLDNAEEQVQERRRLMFPVSFHFFLNS